jgi:hypothetical protein
MNGELVSIKVPKVCPWCGEDIIERLGPEQTALLGTIVYGCRTRLAVYGAMFQVTSTKHLEESGWRGHDQI